MIPLNTHLFLLILLFLNTHLAISSGYLNFDVDLLKKGEIDSMVGAGRACAGKIGECRGEETATTRGAEEEFLMDSEVSRRILAMQKRYISYDTLRRDAVPCSTPGASYYNCGNTQANRFHRGCEVITRCARTTQG